MPRPGITQATANGGSAGAISPLARRNGSALDVGHASNGAVEATAGSLPPIALRERVPAHESTLLPADRAGRMLKRTADLFVATALLVLLAPLFLAIAVLIKMDSPGPILYRSRRIGRNGEAFDMFKFRTMVDGADSLRDSLRAFNEAPEGLFKVTGDPRMTRVGRWLRATSLDELPQLLQVISGKMSLVGPRPLVEDESSLIPADSLRFRGRPGITGPWQIAGSWQVPIPEMVRMDAAYLEEWSLWLDVKLLVGTLIYALRRDGV